MPRIKALLAGHNVAAQFHCTQTPQEMESTTRRLIRGGAKVLLAMGGDGTLQMLANAVLGSDSTWDGAAGSDVVLGVLPAGGGNDFARALGLSGNAVAATGAILRGSIRWVDLARARTGDGRERLYCGGGGVGLDAEAARYAGEASARVPGRLRYVLAALRALRSYAPIKVRAEFPDSALEPVEKKVLVAAALNTPTYGAGLRLAPGASIDDGLLDIVFVEELTAREVAGVVLRWAVSEDLRTRRITRWTASRVKLTTACPGAFQGDGEILGPTPVEIEAVPRAMRILTGMPS